MDAGNMADDFQGMESQNPDMGDGFSVFQMDDSALTGQNLPFGTPDDENGFAQGAGDGMQEVPPATEEGDAGPYGIGKWNSHWSHRYGSV